jgi:hypothetical protein
MSAPLTERIGLCPACHGAGVVYDLGWRACATCEEHGIGDLVTAEVADCVEAATRAARHLAGWRASHSRDGIAARDALEGLAAVVSACLSAEHRLREEIAHTESSARLCTARARCAERGRSSRNLW